MPDHGLPDDSTTLVAPAAEADAAPARFTQQAPTLAESASPEAPVATPAVTTVQPAAASPAAPTAEAAKTELTEADYGPIPRTFDEMGLSQDVSAALRDMG